MTMEQIINPDISMFIHEFKPDNFEFISGEGRFYFRTITRECIKELTKIAHENEFIVQISELNKNLVLMY